MKAESLGGAQIRTAFCSVSGTTCDTVASSHSLDNLSASTLSSDLTCSPNKQSHLFNSSWRATSAAEALSNGVRRQVDGRSQCCNSVSLKKQTDVATFQSWSPYFDRDQNRKKLEFRRER